MKKLYYIVLKGNEKVWAVNTMQHEEEVLIYQEEGLPIIRYPFTTKMQEWRERLFPAGRLFSIDVEGKTSQWSFLTHLTSKALRDMRNDGIDSFYEVVNLVPGWVARAGLVRPWCFMQDLLNFRWNELLIDKSKF